MSDYQRLSVRSVDFHGLYLVDDLPSNGKSWRSMIETMLTGMQK
jgi:hypothetical protein